MATLALVDDDENIVESLKMFFEAEGYKIDHNLSHRAWAEVRNASATTDFGWQMPGGLHQYARQHGRPCQH